MSYNFNSVSVLVAEDIQMMRDLTCYALDCLGIKNIIKAANGSDAYDLYKLHSPDIVLCDWQMAPVNGLELVKKIRGDSYNILRSVPIIMITGHASLKYVQEARDAGVNEFLVKPFTGESLAARLSSVIERPRAFVETQDYFGPDRRRKIAGAFYDGPMRREGDIAAGNSWSVDF